MKTSSKQSSSNTCGYPPSSKQSKGTEFLQVEDKTVVSILNITKVADLNTCNSYKFGLQKKLSCKKLQNLLEICLIKKSQGLLNMSANLLFFFTLDRDSPCSAANSASRLSSSSSSSSSSAPPMPPIPKSAISSGLISRPSCRNQQYYCLKIQARAMQGAVRSGTSLEIYPEFFFQAGYLTIRL